MSLLDLPSVLPLAGDTPTNSLTVLWSVSFHCLQVLSIQYWSDTVLRIVCKWLIKLILITALILLNAYKMHADFGAVTCCAVFMAFFCLMKHRHFLFLLLVKGCEFQLIDRSCCLSLFRQVGKNMTFCPDKCCILKGINFAGVRYVLICRRGIDTDDTSKQLLWQLFLEPWKICLTARIKFVEFQLKMCGQEGVA